MIENVPVIPGYQGTLYRAGSDESILPPSDYLLLPTEEIGDRLDRIFGLIAFGALIVALVLAGMLTAAIIGV
jgi:hypothetical protein